MTDDRVDDLLKELDEALSVEPSPAVAARVRTRIADAPARRLAVVPRLTLAAAVAVVIAAGYAAWRQHEPVPASPHTQAQNRAGAPAAAPDAQTPRGIEAPAPADTPPGRVPAATRSLTHAPRAASTQATRPAEPEVIVSPDVRLALKQLDEALRDGLLMDPAPSRAEPATIIPAAIEVSGLEIETVSIGPPPLPAGPRGNPEDASGPSWPADQSPRTRRTS